MNNYPVQYQRQSSYPMQAQNNPNYYFAPQGMVYFVSSSQDINGFPTNGSVAVFINPNEDKVYVRTTQNGMPVILEYVNSTGHEKNSDLSNRLAAIESRLDQLERSEINKRGGTLDGLL